MEEYHHKLHITSLLNHNLYVTAQVKDYLLGSFNKSQRIKNYLPSAYYPRKKELPVIKLE